MKYILSVLLLLVWVLPVWAIGNPVIKNTGNRPVRVTTALPRVVTNQMSSIYASYTNPNWGQFKTGSSTITYGGSAQTLTMTSPPACACTAFSSFNFDTLSGQKWMLSYSIDAWSGGGPGESIVQLTGVAATGTTTDSSATLGRHAIVFTTTAAGLATMRFGLGIDSANSNNQSVTFSDVMLELVDGDQSRTYPYEYVNAGDSRAFNYTYTGTMTGTVLTSTTLGSPYPIAKHQSVLVIGDSFCDDIPTGGNMGDFPYQLRNQERDLHQGWGTAWQGTPNYYSSNPKNTAVSFRCLGSQTISQITTLLNNALAETSVTTGVIPWTVVIAEGGINDINASIPTDQAQADAILASMKAAKLAQIAVIAGYGAVPVLVNVAPRDLYITNPYPYAQATLEAYNTWLATLGYPTYDMFADANDGTGKFKTTWASLDGIHPGVQRLGGQSFITDSLAQLLTHLP